MEREHFPRDGVIFATLIGIAMAVAVAGYHASVRFETTTLTRVAEHRSAQWATILEDAFSLSGDGSTALAVAAANGGITDISRRIGGLQELRYLTADGVVSIATDPDAIGQTAPGSQIFDRLRSDAPTRQIAVIRDDAVTTAYAHLDFVQRGQLSGALELVLDLSDEARIIGAAFDRARLFGFGAYLLLLAVCGLAIHYFVASRRTTAERLSAARAGAAAENESRLEMLAFMSHQLRTPLNTIMGFAEVIRDEMFGPIERAKYKEYAAGIHQSGGQLMNALADIIDVSQPQTDEIPMVDQEVDVADVAHQALDAVRAAAEARDVRLSLVTRNPVSRVRGDRQLILRMLTGLMSHAVSQSVRGGQCRLTLTREIDGSAVFQASDASVTQAGGQAGLNFALSGRVESGPAARGAGAGLALAKVLAERQGGAVEFSRRIGGGTCIRIRFPAARSIGLRLPVIRQKPRPVRGRIAAKLASAG